MQDDAQSRLIRCLTDVIKNDMLNSVVFIHKETLWVTGPFKPADAISHFEYLTPEARENHKFQGWAA